jgi:hypothetical protein
MLRLVVPSHVGSRSAVWRRAVYHRFVAAFLVGMMIACSAHIAAH